MTEITGTTYKSRSKEPIWKGWALLIFLLLLTLLFARFQPWIWMWTLCFALWLSLKWMCWQRQVFQRRLRPSLLYFLWPGMDAAAFLPSRRKGRIQKNWGWVPMLIAGYILLCFVTPRLHLNPYWQGWCGVVAMLCLMHFGAFTVLALLWQRLGYPVKPIMEKPWLASGLGDFWGNRWNRAFSDWTRFAIFHPLRKRWGLAGGMFAGFIASGLIHEIAISLPARGGWGLPSFYFLIQAIALHLEKNYFGHPLLIRLWTIAIVLLPAPLLFHSPFLNEVFVPMLSTILKYL